MQCNILHHTIYSILAGGECGEILFRIFFFLPRTLKARLDVTNRKSEVLGWLIIIFLALAIALYHSTRAMPVWRYVRSNLAALDDPHLWHPSQTLDPETTVVWELACKVCLLAVSCTTSLNEIQMCQCFAKKKRTRTALAHWRDLRLQKIQAAHLANSSCPTCKFAIHVAWILESNANMTYCSVPSLMPPIAGQ